MTIWLKSLIHKRFLLLFSLSILLLILSIGGSLLFGSIQIPFPILIQTLLGNFEHSSTTTILYQVRIPRTLAACASGAALAVAGCILQTVMNNPLASPSVIGINSGAALGALITFIFFPYHFEILPLAAFFGALLTALLVYFISLKTGASQVSIVLTGIAISTILGAVLDLLTTLNPDAFVGATSFMIGGFSGITYQKITWPIIYILIGLSGSLLFSKALDILMLGDDMAKTLGLRVTFYRFILIMMAALLAGSAVSFSGLLSFVGLLIPHIIRQFIRSNHTHLLILTILLGAFFVTTCDLLVRIIFAPYEIPVGIMMSFLGGPFFIYLLLCSKRRDIRV